MKKLVNFISAASVAAVASISLAVAAPAAPTTSNVFNAKQQQAIGQIVHNYLVQNPEVLIEAAQALQAKQQKAQSTQALPKIQSNADQLFNDKNSPVAGNTNGKIVLVEFYDFRCPHCKDASKSVEALVKANPNLKVVYKDFPIFGGSSLTAAKASLSAWKLDPSKYDAFHNDLMHFDGNLTDTDVLNIAKQAGYNTAALQKEMNQAWVAKQIQDDMKLGASIGINATPMFVVGNPAANKYAFVPGAYPQKFIQGKIDSVV